MTKTKCEDPLIPESDFEGAWAVVLGVGGQGIFQKAQWQVVLHHSVQHQANVALRRNERRGRAVSSGTRQAVRLHRQRLLNSSALGCIHTWFVQLQRKFAGADRLVYLEWSVNEWDSKLWLERKESNADLTKNGATGFQQVNHVEMAGIRGIQVCGVFTVCRCLHRRDKHFEHTILGPPSPGPSEPKLVGSGGVALSKVLIGSQVVFFLIKGFSRFVYKDCEDMGTWQQF